MLISFLHVLMCSRAMFFTWMLDPPSIFLVKKQTLHLVSRETGRAAALGDGDFFF